MRNFLFKQLEFIRNTTLEVSNGISEADADIIPEGFRNNIRWNLGHIYLVQEKFAFSPVNLSLHVPEGYMELFTPGTSPLDWSPETPSLEEIRSLLKTQHARIQAALKDRLEEAAAEPYKTKSGLVLETSQEFLSFCLYHEGMHVNTIKNFKTLIAKEKSTIG